MHCNFVFTLAILSSLLVPALSLAVPQRLEVERYGGNIRNYSDSLTD